MENAVLGWVCSCGHGCMVHAYLCDRRASCTDKNTDVQIRSSQGPSVGLVEGPHEGINAGTQYENGVIYIPVYHLRDGVH